MALVTEAKGRCLASLPKDSKEDVMSQMGERDDPTKAVLDATGKRYLVEHQEAEDGSWWYDLYSDGFIRQGGLVDMPNVEYTMTATINFPKTITRMLNPNAVPYRIKSWTKNSITISVEDEHNYVNQPMQCFWIVEAMI